MVWIFYFIGSFLAMVLCYLTNPIVCLFSDEYGELHGFLKYWQTWDDSLNPRFFVVDKAPRLFRYDYDRHYEEYEGTTPELAAVGRTRWFVKIKDPNFTFWEKVQRYFCQVLWLTRNCSYGFSFWMLGRQVTPENWVWVKMTNHFRFGYDKSQSILTRTWCLKTDQSIWWIFRWDVFMGWKVNESFDHPIQCMIANRALINLNSN